MCFHFRYVQYSQVTTRNQEYKNNDTCLKRQLIFSELNLSLFLLKLDPNFSVRDEDCGRTPVCGTCRNFRDFARLEKIFDAYCTRFDLIFYSQDLI